jgi:Protein of unknown function (DUF3551)
MSTPPRKRRHRGLARPLVAVRWRAILMVPKGQRPHPRRADRRGVSLEDAGDNVASFSNAIKSANALPSDRGVHAAEEAVMRTIPLVLITFVALSLSTSAARAGANGSWCANYGTGHSGINCSYTSQQQCLASVSGVYGFCTPNPYPGTGYGTGGAWNLTPVAL